MITVVEFSKVLLTQNKSCCVLSSSHACGDLFARGKNYTLESTIHMSQVAAALPRCCTIIQNAGCGLFLC